MKEETVLYLHPDPTKQGTRIAAEKYQALHQAILAAFSEQEELSYQEMVQPVSARLAGSFDGSVEWYFNAVKLDMEARGELVRTRKSNPVRFRIVR